MELLDAANTGDVRPPGPDRGARSTPSQGQGDPRLGPRPEGPRGAPEADRGQGHQRLHARRDAPATATRSLKKYKHLVGNYGGAWQDQRKEFDAFPGAILMTTNCIQKPKETYIGRIFTCGLSRGRASRTSGRHGLRAGHRGGAGRPGLRQRTGADKRSCRLRRTRCWAWRTR